MKIIFVSFFTALLTFTLYSCEKAICISKEPATPVNTTGITSWDPVSSPTTSTLLDVTFINATTGFIVGNDGTILKTTNKGNTWTALNSGITSDIRSIHMFNGSKGIAVGSNGVILKTNDGGSTWQKTVVAGNPTLDKILFLDDNKGFIGGLAGTFLKTIDGGATWSSVNSGSSSSIYGIHFVNAQIGYICGQAGYIAKTIDGGDSWTAQASGVGNYPHDLLLNIKFSDADNGYVIGESIPGNVADSYILHTTDGGANWVRGTYPFTNIAMNGLGVVNASTAYVTGGDVNANTYYILKTTDGQNWSTIATGSRRLSGLYMLNESIAFTVGLNGIILKGK